MSDRPPDYVDGDGCFCCFFVIILPLVCYLIAVGVYWLVGVP